MIASLARFRALGFHGDHSGFLRSYAEALRLKPVSLIVANAAFAAGKRARELGQRCVCAVCRP